jgi:hypothetical protein
MNPFRKKCFFDFGCLARKNRRFFWEKYLFSGSDCIFFKNLLQLAHLGLALPQFSRLQQFPWTTVNNKYLPQAMAATSSCLAGAGTFRRGWGLQ